MTTTPLNPPKPVFPLLPLGEDFIVLMDPIIQKTEAGVHITEGAKVQPPMGTVVAIGSEVPEKWPMIKVGTRVQWISQPSTEIEIQGKKGFLKMNALDLAGIILDLPEGYISSLDPSFKGDPNNVPTTNNSN